MCVFLADTEKLVHINPVLEAWKVFENTRPREIKGALVEEFLSLALGLFRMEWKSTIGSRWDQRGVDFICRVLMGAKWIGIQAKSSVGGIQHFIAKNEEFAKSIVILSVDVKDTNSKLSAVVYLFNLLKELNVELKWEIKELFKKVYKLTNDGKTAVRYSYKQAKANLNEEENIHLLLTLGIAKRVEGGDIKIEIKHQDFINLISKLK